jgi:hypothetical protein
VGTTFKIPIPPKYERPPAAAIESVHPGKGWLSAQAIIDGLMITVFTCPWLFSRFFSAKFFEKV